MFVTERKVRNMSVASKYNKVTHPYQWPANRRYMKLQDVGPVRYLISHIYTHTGLYGEQGYFVVEHEEVDSTDITAWVVQLPTWYTPTVLKLMQDDEVWAAIDTGNLYFERYSYIDKRGQTRYGVNLFDGD